MFHRPVCPVARSSRLNQLARRAVVLRLAALVALLTLGTPALAAEPNVRECLAASDASIELETQGKLIEARSALRTCAQHACPQEIREECARRIELVESRVPSAVIEVRDSSGRLRRDARVTVDGVAMASSEHPTELDPGAHLVTAELPGAPSSSRSFRMNPGEKRRLLRLTLAAPVVLPPKMEGRSRRVAALVTGGLGVGSLVAGSVFAAMAVDRKHEAERICPDNPCASRAGAERWESAHQAGDMATAFVVGGSAALAVAAGLWLTLPEPSMAVGVGPGRIQMKARF
jgi:hypothetical protein